MRCHFSTALEMSGLFFKVPTCTRSRSAPVAHCKWNGTSTVTSVSSHTTIWPLPVWRQMQRRRKEWERQQTSNLISPPIQNWGLSTSHTLPPLLPSWLSIGSIYLPVTATFISTDYFDISTSSLSAAIPYLENAFDHCVVVKSCSMPVPLYIVSSNIRYLSFLRDYNFLFSFSQRRHKRIGLKEKPQTGGIKMGDASKEETFGFALTACGSWLATCITNTYWVQSSTWCCELYFLGEGRILIIWKRKVPG